ncbi:MAG: 3-phosphoglycerate dehydrogenase [Phycisphaeraceae bacterium]|nr:3-phosphoglycerate dehydrogenase [Phycisphaeraceae bacterium]MCB9848867.1 3-phosphoglycerate dehydrogenase [Phycisphaeraceae bacterium]
MNASDRRDRPLVAIAEPIDPVCQQWLSAHCDCRGLESLAEADALIVRTSTRVDRALLESGPRLRVVGRAGVGVDHIDLAVCAERGITVVHTPDANTDAVVEYVFAELLDTLRPRPAVDGAMTSLRWEAVREEAVAPVALAGTAMGVLGFGRIGSRVARAASGFGMVVRCCDLVEIPQSQRFGAEQVGFDELLATSQILTIHVDGRAGNRGLINAGALGRCRDDVILVNTSRGLVVDAHALAQFLEANQRARAICDVHEPEPIESDNPLLGLPSARLTPHIASATAGAKRAMSWVVRDVWRVLSGEAPMHEAPMDADRSLPA